MAIRKLRLLGKTLTMCSAAWLVGGFLWICAGSVIPNWKWRWPYTDPQQYESAWWAPWVLLVLPALVGARIGDYLEWNFGPTDDKSVVAEVKHMLRNASGARDFVIKANQAGFRKVREDFSGLYMKRGECALGITVIASRGPDSIWCLSIANKGSGIVNLVDEGKFTF